MGQAVETAVKAKASGAGNGDVEYSAPQVVLGAAGVKPKDFVGDDLQWGAVCVVQYIYRYGIVPVSVLRKLFAKEAYDVAVATYLTMHRWITQTHMTWKGRDFTPALRAAVEGASPQKLMEVPFAPTRKKQKAAAAVYSFRIRFTEACLGGMPGQELATGGSNNGNGSGSAGATDLGLEAADAVELEEGKQRVSSLLHQRDAAGRPLLMERHWQAMFGQALMLLGQQDWPIRSRAVRFANSSVEAASLGSVRLSIIVKRKGVWTGLGVTEFEALPAGTEVEGRMMASVDDLGPEMAETALKVAGEFVGMSPARAHRGFGRFEVLWFRMG